MTNKPQCPRCRDVKSVIPVEYGKSTKERVTDSVNGEIWFVRGRPDIYKWYCGNCDKLILPKKPYGWTKKHFEAPFQEIEGEYARMLEVADEKYIDKLLAACKVLGYENVGNELYALCLWLSLGCNERKELSKRLRKCSKNIIQVCINKLDALLEENSELEMLSGVKLPKEDIIKARTNLYDRLGEIKKTRGHHLKELVEEFNIATFSLWWEGKGQKDEVDFIYNLMKAFDFEWESEGFKVYMEGELVKSFRDELYAKNFINKSENREELLLKKGPLTVHDLDEDVIKNRIRTEIQQVNARKWKTTFNDIKHLRPTI